MLTIPKKTRATSFSKFKIGRPWSPSLPSASPKSTASSNTCKISPSENALTKVFGMMCIRKSTVPMPWAADVYFVTLPAPLASVSAVA